ncbi:serine O-acetyltransferase EpsC [Athalassotoga saccharophila]|uniref:serine O-acetyltransferase EpsC n=1 Tax=Athalassotoga saccharophila TaxID=1441386 RepID=UPI001379EFC4|nr:serine O-acetyltransferase EpsC [Athalassotoga saccharophila]
MIEYGVPLFKEIGFTFHAIKEDFKAGKRLDPSVKSGRDIFLFSASFHGLMLYRFSHLFWNLKMRFLAMTLRYINRVLYKMDIHPAANIEAGIFIDHGIGVVIGETASVGSGSLIYHGVTLGTARIMQGKRHPTIGRNVLIGANAVILGPVKIGDGSRIGANAVVLEDVPEFSTAVGNPARIVKKQVRNCEFNLNNRKDTDRTFEDDEPLVKT